MYKILFHNVYCVWHMILYAPVIEKKILIDVKDHKNIYIVDGLTFQTKSSTLNYLLGPNASKNWSWDKYFKLGKYGNKFTSQADLSVIQVSYISHKGIDLAKKHKDVARIFYSGFNHIVTASGYDPQDVLQEVYKGILSRNQGKGAWDAEKSSFGHYVHMVCSCIVKNYHRKYKTNSGLSPLEDYEKTLTDSLGDMVSRIDLSKISQRSNGVVQMLLEGHTQKNIARKYNTYPGYIRKISEELENYVNC